MAGALEGLLVMALKQVGRATGRHGLERAAIYPYAAYACRTSAKVNGTSFEWPRPPGLSAVLRTAIPALDTDGSALRRAFAAH